MSRSQLEYLRHIMDEIDYLSRRSQNLSRAEFINDETLQRAFSRSIEIIGEATKHVAEDIRLKYPHVQWRAMAGMRDLLIHRYFGVDYEIVWDVVTNKIPELRDNVEAILQSESK